MLEELYEHEGVDVKHYLMVDSHFTWWGMGRSYLCRMVDMVHMGYVDEVLFGYEVVERIPALAAEWLATADRFNDALRSAAGVRRRPASGPFVAQAVAGASKVTPNITVDGQPEEGVDD